MTKEQAFAWLDKLFVKIPASQERSVWTQSECPLQPWQHDDGKSGSKVFGIKVEEGESLCKCFSCGFVGSQTDLLNRLRYLNKVTHYHDYLFGQLFEAIILAEQNAELNLDTPSIETVITAGKEPIHVFPDWWLESFPSYRTSSECLAYLRSRDVPSCVADAFDLRYDSSQARLCFPVRDFAGALVGLHGRAIYAEIEPRYRMYRYAKKNNPIVWLGEQWVDLNKPVLAVEGPLDLVQVVRVYRNAVSPLFAIPGPDKMRRMGSVLSWGTLLDNGKAGNTGRQRWNQSYPQAVIEHLYPPIGKDPGNAGLEALTAIIGEYFTLDDVILD